MSTKVKLYKKLISGNRFSLFLDFYPPIFHPETGEPKRREFLGMYLIKNPKQTIDKQLNKEVLDIAENIKARRQIDILKGNFDFLTGKKKNKTDFLQFFNDHIETKTGSTKKGYQTTYLYFEQFTNGKCPVVNLNENFCTDFGNYLLSAKQFRNSQIITQNSAKIYFSHFKSVLKQAFKKGLIEKDISTQIGTIRKNDVQRNYLSFEELQTLIKTPCVNQNLKNASLFSALTGLRISDIIKLVWSEVQYNEQQGYYLQFKQKKTKSNEILPISEQAFSLLGSPKDPNVQVFEGLKYSVQLNKILKEWIGTAGIAKEITFHCFRHTFATLQLLNGTDIYTVSKMLGHRDLKTTQIYAKIIDQTKRVAADKIKLDM